MQRTLHRESLFPVPEQDKSLSVSLSLPLSLLPSFLPLTPFRQGGSHSSILPVPLPAWSTNLQRLMEPFSGPSCAPGPHRPLRSLQTKRVWRVQLVERKRVLLPGSYTLFLPSFFQGKKWKIRAQHKPDGVAREKRAPEHSPTVVPPGKRKT